MKLSKQLTFSIALAGLSLGMNGTALAHGHHAPHVTINFATGSTMLSEADEAALRSLVREARATDSSIEEITVAAWSDKALPESGMRLSSSDELIAASRVASIKDFLKTEMDVADVNSYNMAVSSNWAARAINTRDAELKSAFSKRGSDVGFSNGEFNVIESEGGPSKAVAVVEFKRIKASLAPKAHFPSAAPQHNLME